MQVFLYITILYYYIPTYPWWYTSHDAIENYCRVFFYSNIDIEPRVKRRSHYIIKNVYTIHVINIILFRGVCVCVCDNSPRWLPILCSFCGSICTVRKYAHCNSSNVHTSREYREYNSYYYTRIIYIYIIVIYYITDVPLFFFFKYTCWRWSLLCYVIII